MAKVAYSESNGVDLDSNENPSSASTTILFMSSPPRWLRPALVVGCLLCVVGLVCIIVGAVLMGLGTNQCPSLKSESQKNVNPQCEFSPEAKRVDLEGFLKEVQSKYYEMNPEYVAWQPGVTDIREHIKNR